MSRISKGKLKHLWALYDVWNIISFRDATFWFFEPSPEFKATVDKWLLRTTADNNPVNPMVRQIATKGYYDGCRKVDSEFDIETVISVATLENPVHLTIMRDKPRLAGVPGKIIAYDIEADVYRVPCGGFNHEHSASGRIYAKGSFDRMKHLDVADTYPKTIEVFDEEKFDRLVSGMLATPPIA